MARKIVIADDHQLLIDGIRTVIQQVDDVEIAAEFNNGSKLLEYLATAPVELVLLDLNMPGTDGLRCLEIIRERHAGLKTLVLTSYNQPEIIAQVQKMGANGYLFKNASSQQLKEAIETVLNGDLFFSAGLERETAATSDFFIDDFMRKFQLTRREVDIIRLVCRELSSKQIAAELFLSEFTVNTHRKNIFRKLDIRNVAGLVNFAKANGLL